MNSSWGVGSLPLPPNTHTHINSQMPLEQPPPSPPPLKVTNLRVTAQKRQLFCGWASVVNWAASGALRGLYWVGGRLVGWSVCLVGWMEVTDCRYCVCRLNYRPWWMEVSVRLCDDAMVNVIQAARWVAWFIMNFSCPIHFYRHFIPRSPVS